MRTAKFLITLLLIITVAFTASAYDFSVGGIRYTKTSSNTVEVAGYNVNTVSSVLEIPSTIEYGEDIYSVTSIGDSSFSYCIYLTSVTIPNSVTSIGDYAFYGCTSLTSVAIPNTIKGIGNETFYGCTSLASVAIPESVTTISDYAFYGCSALASVSIPNSVTTIGDYAFSGCIGLGEVHLGTSVETIGAEAFSGCAINSITIPGSVKQIRAYAFSTNSLKEIYTYAENPPEISVNTFESYTYDTANLYVPTGCVDAYMNYPWWSLFYNISEGSYAGINDIIADEAAGKIVGYYNLQGVFSDKPWHGMNIVIYSDGSCCNVVY